MKQIEILPGILEQDSEEFEAKMLQASKFTDKVFIDIIDGKFAQNMTVGMDELMESSTELSMYVQLMTQEPINYLNQCSEAGIELVVGHVELMESQAEFLDKGEMLSLKAGLALDLETPIDFIDEGIMDRVEAILLMAVKAGFSEQEFDRRVLVKMQELRGDGFRGDVFVDGGVNKDTAEACVKAGASGLSITSGIWKADDSGKAYGELVKLVNK